MDTLSVPAVHLRLEDDLRRGGIEAQLLCPVSPLLMRLAEAAGGMAVRLVVLGGAGAVALQFAQAPAWGVGTWAALAVLGLLGAVLGPALLAQGIWIVLLGLAVAGLWRAGLQRVLREGV